MGMFSFGAGSSSHQAPNRDIRSQFGRTASSTNVTGREVASAVGHSHSGQPLGTVSGNAHASTEASKLPNGRGFQGQLSSLYDLPDDAFLEDPDLNDIGLQATVPKVPTPVAVSAATPSPAMIVTAGVTFYEDDFDDADLEFLEPVALAAAPKKQDSAAASAQQPKDQNALSSSMPPPATPVKPHVVSLVSSQPVPWSSSPPSHFAVPPGRIEPQPDPTTTSLKRSNFVDDVPMQKRRVLPASFGTRSYSTARTPVAPKTRDAYALELTASAMREQKQKHKFRTGTARDDSSALETTEPGYERAADPITGSSLADPVTRSSLAKSVAISLSVEQQNVLDLVVNQGRSVFFTGPAGTGKSVLMRAIIDELRTKYAHQPERVAVTASTGFAACNIGGITLHSFSGIGLGKEDAATLVKKVRRNPVAKQRWLKTKVLIIDEVSMVDGDLFDKLSQIGRQIRANSRPWGGLQLIITGDFFQLPPVPEGGRDAKFAFDATTWNTSIDHTIGLTQVFRQRDPVFASMLNEMRLGRLDSNAINAFKALERPLPVDCGIEPTELFSTRGEVETANARKLTALPGESVKFTSLDTGRPDYRDKLLQNMMAPPVLSLKIGAQVMLIKNLDERLVNGTQGTVIAFRDASSVLEDPTDGPGMAPEARQKIRAFANSALAKSNVQYPEVEFRLSNGGTQRVICEPHDWKVELPNGDVQASRKQVPLILAWALSIHKAQGQTLERVRVNLHRVFEKGQAYVALSRATSQEGLQVLGFQPSKIMAHTRVIEFYQRLYTVDQLMSKTIASVASTSAVPTTATVVGGRKNIDSVAPKPAAIFPGPPRKNYQTKLTPAMPVRREDAKKQAYA